MTVEELRLCATRPFRLQRAVSRGHPMHLTVVCRFELLGSDDNLPMFFLPGGRILVTMTDDGSINLWDMQTSVAWDSPKFCQSARPITGFRAGSSDVTEPKLGFSYQYHAEERRVVLLYNSRSGNDVYVQSFLLVIYNSSNLVISIYRISFLEWRGSSEQPSIIAGPRLRMDELFEVDDTEAKPFGHDLENDIVCIWYRKIVCVWDWRQNTWAWLRVKDYIPVSHSYRGSSITFVISHSRHRWYSRIKG